MSQTNAVPPNSVGSINEPEFLDFVSTHLRRPRERTILILIGSPFYRDAGDNFDMRNAFPSDGHLIADQRESVFSVQAKRQRLEGVALHHAYFRECFVNDYHKDRVSRFWSLFVSEQGGVLASFAADLSVVLARAKNTHRPFATPEIDRTDTKLEMRHIAPRNVPVWFPSTNVLHSTEVRDGASAQAKTNSGSTQSIPTPIVIAPNSVQEPIKIPVVVAEPQLPATEAIADPLPVAVPISGIGIGIMWKSAVDLDLYVRPRGQTPELSYRRRSTLDGKYYHDYRNANDGIDYEYVELNPTDIRNVQAWVNCYRGRADKPINGVFVVRFAGKSYSHDFTISNGTGNGGRDSNKRETSSFWIKLDILSVINESKVETR